MPGREKSVSALEDHLGYWLRFVSNYVSSSFQRRLAEKGVTVAEWVALRSLQEKSPCSLSQLVEEMGMDKGRVSRLVDRLHKRGFAHRKISRDDRRSVEIVITAAGQDLLPVLAGEADENDHQFFGHLSQKEARNLKVFLKNVVERHELKTKPID